MENRNIQPLGSSNHANRVQSVEQKKYKAASSDEMNHVPNSDKATVSNAAQVLSKSLTALNEVDDVRQEKVAALKEQIDNGTYEIKYQNIASRLEKIITQMPE